MSVRDALVLVAHRAHLPDLERALALIGVGLVDGTEPVTLVEPVPAAPPDAPAADEEPEVRMRPDPVDGWTAAEVRLAEASTASPAPPDAPGDDADPGGARRHGPATLES